MVDEPFRVRDGASTGPLVGSTFVVKDLVDVLGCTVRSGQPTWAATHGPARADAPVVTRLLAAGARLVGRTHTAEMAYSLSGRDDPYGMPVNPSAPDLDTGGSSSGSAAAVAGGLADLGVGTDTLGSIRVPASSCGLYGWRPTHGLVPAEGVHPLAASLDTVGLLARDLGLLHRGAQVLAARPLDQPPSGRCLLAADAFALLEPELAELLRDGVRVDAEIELAPPGRTLAELTLTVRDVQGPEFAAAHRAWIESARPTFGPGVGERIAHALGVTPEAHIAAEAVRDEVRAHLAAVVGVGDVVVLPAAGPPPRRDADEATVAAARALAAGLSVVGSLAGAPTVTVPAANLDGVPLGRSWLARPGEDGTLFRALGGR